MKQIIKKINFFFKKKKIHLLWNIKTCIYYFFNEVHDLPHLTALGIKDIKVKETKQHYDVIIDLERPGLLIGKGGETIKKLELRLTNFLGKKTKIKIIENKFWMMKKLTYKDC